MVFRIFQVQNEIETPCLYFLQAFGEVTFSLNDFFPFCVLLKTVCRFLSGSVVVLLFSNFFVSHWSFEQQLPHSKRRNSELKTQNSCKEITTQRKKTISWLDPGTPSFMPQKKSRGGWERLVLYVLSVRQSFVRPDNSPFSRRTS